jgi:4-hydroxyacetophenone monooxygenase
VTEAPATEEAPHAGDQAAGETLRAALEEANLPTLQMVVHRLTGEERWLQEPFRPTKARGMEEHDTGGLPEEAQRALREGAFEAITAWREGRLEPAPEPSPERMAQLLEIALGEEVPESYGELLAEEMGVTSREVEVRAPAPEGFEVLVIGAGMAGIDIAIHMERAGVPYTVIEKNETVGGTWLENRYPGCGVDTPSHLYSFSFATRPDWTHYYADRDQLASYFEELADEHGIRERIQFGTEVLSARWDDEASRWIVRVRRADGTTEELSAKVVVSAVGHFNRPKVPPIEGLETFPGPCMHTARWDPDVELTGKRVAVIGTGASAMQLVPALAGRAERLFVFQGSRQWVIPTPSSGRPVSPGVQYLLSEVPFYAGWYRLRHLWRFGDRVHPALRVDPDYPEPDVAVNEINERHRRALLAYMESELEGHPDLIAASTPDYPPYARRPLFDHGWYKAIRRDDVELIEGRVTEVRGSTIVTDGGDEAEVDAIALATGFQTLEILGPMEIRGRSGRTLRETWGEEEARAYLGMTVPDFPNFFILFGPNTNTGHGGSAFLTTEMQVRYVMGVLAEMIDGGIESVECRPEVFDAYDAELLQALAGTVYSHHKAHGYYRNKNDRIIGSSPWEYLEYWGRTLTPDMGDYLTAYVNDR